MELIISRTNQIVIDDYKTNFYIERSMSCTKVYSSTLRCYKEYYMPKKHYRLSTKEEKEIFLEDFLGTLGDIL